MVQSILSIVYILGGVSTIVAYAKHVTSFRGDM